MTDTLRFTVLGCGSSGGVPRLGGLWGDCDPAEPRNLRRRCSMLVERIGPDGTTRVLIDASPDLRAQLLDAGVGVLDAVLFTHSHADHCHGIDDLRMIVFNTGERLAVWADHFTRKALEQRFDYVFVTPEGSSYPPILQMNEIAGPVRVSGKGGEIVAAPFTVGHGGIDALGFRIGGLVYLPDVATMTDAAWKALEGLDILVIDALRRKPHPTHSHLAQTLDWIARVEPERAVVTNMHVDLDYRTLLDELPEGVEPAFDGMVLTLPAPAD
ncbi:MBL fold metallo-hydrolase [Oceaniovalibus guishaninsula]|nr:MBL fold metallo-hydrolase [Oceaniovalibus guishaninsula]